MSKYIFLMKIRPNLDYIMKIWFNLDLYTTCELKKSESIPKYIKNQTKIRLKYNFDKNILNKWAVRMHSNGRKLLKSDYIDKYQTKIFSNPK